MLISASRLEILTPNKSLSALFCSVLDNEVPRAPIELWQTATLAPTVIKELLNELLVIPKSPMRWSSAVADTPTRPLKASRFDYRNSYNDLKASD